MEAEYGDVSRVLEGTTILVTGAAGFVGTALLYRLLLDPKLSSRVKRVLALIRGSTFEEAVEKLPPALRELARPIGTDEADAKLLILRGDCRHAQLGLTGPSLQTARQADVVIHAAGETRFMLGLSDAMDCITDLAYQAARFSLGSSSAKTHIHLSTTYVGWFMRNGSTMTEDFLQNDLDDDSNDTHANTYLHAKTLAEESVNALFKPQAGRPLHGKSVRILRISTLGAAAAFPSPGCGACQTSTPVSAALAAVPVSETTPDRAWIPRDSFLDVLPVDVAVNQILALTASAHKSHTLSPAAPFHPRNGRNPVNARGTNVPVYHVASGLPPQKQLRFLTLNKPEVKIAQPYVKEKSLMCCYMPFIEKQVHFDVSRARSAMGTTTPPSQADDDLVAPTLLFPDSVEDLGSDRASAASPSTSPSLDGSVVFDDDAMMANARRRNSNAALSDLASSISEDAPSDFVEEKEGRPNLSAAAAATASTATAFNVSRTWADQTIDCGALEVDCGKVLEAHFGPMTASADSAAWLGYLSVVRDEMDRYMALAAEDSWVD
ncbi:hypothetical protein MAPG_11735 [Magnaporthiopsis poae ATCC 64411]|uniref:Fatty acyl-CoA reductase n=1 Tax=Magnaporthiopsis poae (strain ATCC 64411 / 73-15) TaxID=644358 RepID=A0A0C4EG21_MAGP6|nr:hypothetical protein MAPG_11735 [Magnaporthiopsis poae ATCC 64411]